MAKDFDWDAHPDAPAEQSTSSFDWNQHPDVSTEPHFDKFGNVIRPGTPTSLAQTPTGDIGMGESFARGAAEQGTLGMYDELLGALGTGGSAAGGAKTALAGITGSDVTNDADVQAYIKRRDEARAAQEAAQKANPLSYGAGELAGGAATLAIPGLGLAEGAGLGGMIAQGAKLGAATGLGSSQAELAKGQGGQALTDVAKGAATGGAMGGLFPTLFGKGIMATAPTAEELAAQYGKAALTGAGLGGVIKAAGSEGGLSDENKRQQLVEDILSGAKYGAIGGIGAKGSAQLGQSLLGSRFGQSMTRAYNEPMNISSEAFGKKVTDETRAMAAKMHADLMEAKQAAGSTFEQAKKEATDEVVNTVKLAEHNKNVANKEMSEIEATTKKMLQQEKALSSAENESALNDANKELLHHTGRLEQIIDRGQKDIGSQMDEIGAKIVGKDTNVTFNVDADINKIKQGLLDSAIPEQQVNAYLRKLNTYVSTENKVPNYEGFKSYKQDLANFFKDPNPYVRSIFRDAYSDSHDILAKTLQNQGYGDELTLLKSLNNRWTALKELEDKVVRPQQLRSFKGAEEQPQIVSPENIALLRKFGSSKAEDIAKLGGVPELLQKVNPEEAQPFVQQTGQLAGKIKGLEEFTPPPVNTEAIQQRISAMPEYQAAQETAAAPLPKAGKPEIEAAYQEKLKAATPESQLGQAQVKQQAVAKFEAATGKLPEDKESSDQLVNLLQRASTEYDPNAQKNLDAIYKAYETTHGPEAASKFKIAAEELAKDMKMGRAAAVIKSTTQTTPTGIISSGLGGMKQAAEIGMNIAGRTKRGLGRMLGLTQDTNALTDVANKATQAGYTKLGSILNNATSKDMVGRNAILFTIHSSPDLRKQFEEVYGKEEPK